MKHVCPIALSLVAAIIAGCPEAHLAGDARPDAAPPLIDAGPGRDATPDAARRPDSPDSPAPPDAPDAPCFDLDGDGAADATCGGDDCDDADPRIGPSSGVCTSATTRLGCAGTERREEPCAAPTAVCEGRTGECAETACGDGVLHPGESCDDANLDETDGCLSTCLYPSCVWNADCPPEAPSCSEVEGLSLRCRPLQAGLGIGERCTTDVECASGWCDSVQGRCTQGCNDNSQCVLGDGWCLPVVGSGHVEVLPQRCAFGCYGHAECPPGSICRVEFFSRLPYEQWAPTWCGAPGGMYVFGEEYVGGWARCYEQVPANTTSETGTRNVCSRQCDSDADCGGDLPNCALFPPGAVPRPAGWATPAAHHCSGVFPSDF